MPACVQHVAIRYSGLYLRLRRPGVAVIMREVRVKSDNSVVCFEKCGYDRFMIAIVVFVDLCTNKNRCVICGQNLVDFLLRYNTQEDANAVTLRERQKGAFNVCHAGRACHPPRPARLRDLSIGLLQGTPTTIPESPNPLQTTAHTPHCNRCRSFS